MRDSRLDLGGIYPPVPTPFDAKGAIDIPSLRFNLEFLSGYDLRGVVLLGSNGEAVHLTMDERVALLESVRPLIPHDRLMIAGTGCSSTIQTIELSQRAADAGADAVLVLPPHYYKSQMTDDVLVRHYHAVGDACPVPVLLYNMPACTGIDMSADTISAIATHPGICGLKDSGGNVAKLGSLAERLGSEFQILAGSAGFLLPALSVGAVGGVLALANIAPAQCLSILEHVGKDEWKAARTVQTRLVDVNAAVTSRWGVAGLKAAMNLLGLHGGHVRAPLQALSESNTARLADILTASGIL